jgi:3-phenylpropionate/trans-cinnamate dioxygenase alpha subunit
VQKWDIGCNWKTIAENFLSDAYHVPSTHASVVDIGFRAPPKLKGYQISPGGGHGFGSEMGGTGTGAATSSEYAKSLENLRKDVASNPANQFIPLGHGTVFPNLSFLDNMKFRLVRVSHPRSPWITESHTMCFVDKAMPDDLRQAVRRDFILSFGPSGMFEVEDGEVWGELTESMRGWVSRNQDFNYQMGLNRHKSVKEDFNVDLPGQSGFYWSELVHRNFYARWRDQMEG